MIFELLNFLGALSIVVVLAIQVSILGRQKEALRRLEAIWRELRENRRLLREMGEALSAVRSPAESLAMPGPERAATVAVASSAASRAPEAARPTIQDGATLLFEPGPGPSAPHEPTTGPVPTFAAAATGPDSAPGRPISAPPPIPREPGRFEAAAREILLRTGNWIVVGEEHRPVGYSMEYAIASTWLLRFGVLILVMGIGFFLKYSIDEGLIAPTGRVALAILAGVALLGGGTRLLGTRYHLLGQGLIGAGIATLYFSIYAAEGFYGLIGAPAAFALMGLVTLCAGALAVRFDSLLIAVLGIIGGYGTPIMLASGAVNYVGLFTYLLVLGAGIFGISLRKNWHLLNHLGLVFTYSLVLAALGDYHPEDFWRVFPFLAGFFVLYSSTLFLFNVIHRVKSTLLELIGLLLNAGIFFAVGYYLVEGRFGYRATAAIALGLAAFYTFHACYFLAKGLTDRGLLVGFMGLAVFFLAVTVPLLLSREWINVCWAVQALVMLRIAGALRSEFLRQLAYVLYAIVLARFLFHDLPGEYPSTPAPDVALGVYLRQMVERLVVLGVPVASMAGAYSLLKQPGPAGPLVVGAANDVAQWVRERRAVQGAVVLALGMGFLFLHLELDRTLRFLFPASRLPVLSMLWVGICLILLSEYRVRPSRVVLALLGAFVAGLLFKLGVYDLGSWELRESMVYGGEYSALDVAMRLVDFGVIVAFFNLASSRLSAGGTPRLSALAGSLALGLAFLFLTLELNTFLSHFVPALQAGGISILWSLFALGLIVGGIHRRATALRFAGLGLFVVVGLKVFLADLAGMDAFYRIIAFILLGVLILSGAFLYLRFQQTFARTPDEPVDKEVVV